MERGANADAGDERIRESTKGVSCGKSRRQIADEDKPGPSADGAESRTRRPRLDGVVAAASTGCDREADGGSRSQPGSCAKPRARGVDATVAAPSRSPAATPSRRSRRAGGDARRDGVATYARASKPTSRTTHGEGRIAARERAKRKSFSRGRGARSNAGWGGAFAGPSRGERT